MDLFRIPVFGVTMKVVSLLSLAFTLLPLGLNAQTHCTVQNAPSAPTPADTAYAHGDFAAAQTLYAAQVAASPTPQAYRGLVHSQLQLDLLPDAAKSAAAAASPASGDALALNGEVLLREGQIPEATRAFSAALAADPCSPLAHFDNARIALILSRGSIATQELTTAHRLAPSDPEITAAWADTLPGPQRAGTLKTLLATNPTLPPAQLTKIATTLATIEQEKSCTAVPYTHADLTMYPLMISGTYPRSWALKVAVNSAELPLLEIDTSVSGIVLNERDAHKAGVHPLIPGSDTGDAPYAAYADTIRIGSVEYHNCPVHVVPAKELANLNSLIGLDFFRDHLIHIDYVTGTVSLAPLPPVPTPSAGPLTDRYIADDEKSWSTAYKVDDNLLVPTFVNKKGPFLFAIDTGSWRTVFARSAGKPVTCLHDSTLLFTGVSGPIVKVLPMTDTPDNSSKVRGPNGSLVKIGAPDNVADLRWGGVDYISRVPLCFDISAKSHATGVDVAGLIGFDDLSPFYIDLNYRDALIHLKFDEMRRYDARFQVRDH